MHLFFFYISAAPESISMVDPVIDEHFRRSLGADYMNLFGKKQDAATKNTSPASSSTEHRRPCQPNQTKPASESSQPSTPSSCSLNDNSLSSPKASPSQNSSPTGVDVVDGIGKSNATIAMSVDDHFAKALGDTWKQLQQAEKQIAANSGGQSNEDEDYFDDDMAADVDDNSSSSSTSTPIVRKKDKSRKMI